MGLISRRSELEAIAQQIAEVDERIAHADRPADRRQRRRQGAGRAAERPAERGLPGQHDQGGADAAGSRRTTTSRPPCGASSRCSTASCSAGRSGRQADGRGEVSWPSRRTALEAEQAERQKQVEELTADQQQLAEELRQAASSSPPPACSSGRCRRSSSPASSRCSGRPPPRPSWRSRSSACARSIEAVAARRGGVEAELAAGHRRPRRRWSRSSRRLPSRSKRWPARSAEAGEAVRG